MAIKGVDPKCFILALFVRDDGERFLLGSGDYVFKDKQMHFMANTIQNDVVEVQGSDGYLLAGQVRRPGSQNFDGYVGGGTDSKEEVEDKRRAFFQFFRKNYFYKVVYVFSNGDAIQRKRGFLVDDPTVKELYQINPEYHVALNFEDVNYYSYSENDQGDEIYAKEVYVDITSSASSSGLEWDAYGVVWDQYGAIWEDGAPSGPTTVDVESIDDVYPVLKIEGPAVNPEISILSTNTTIQYAGSVSGSQTLEIDMFAKTAKLNGVNVVGNITGDWLMLKPGINRITYTTYNPDAKSAVIMWQEIVG